jgi:hypothetical protein
MSKELGFSPAVFGFGVGIFFWGYFVFEVPSNIILDKLSSALLELNGIGGLKGWQWLFIIASARRHLRHRRPVLHDRQA